MKEIVERASDEAIDLIKKLLVFDFEKRLRPDEALKHPFFAEFQEFLADLTLSEKEFDFSFEDQISEPPQHGTVLADIVANSETLAEFRNKELQEAKKASEEPTSADHKNPTPQFQSEEESKEEVEERKKEERIVPSLKQDQIMTQKIQRMVYDEMQTFYPEIYELPADEKKRKLAELDAMYCESIRNAIPLS